MDQPHNLNMVGNVGNATMGAQVDEFEVPGETGGAQKDIDGPSAYQNIELDFGEAPAPGPSIHLRLEIATGNGPQSEPEEGQLARAGNYAAFWAWVKRIFAFLISGCTLVLLFLNIYDIATRKEH